MELLVECVEAMRKKSGSEEHDGLPAMLREARARSLHAGAYDRLGRRLGDARSNRIVASRCLGVLHATEVVLVRAAAPREPRRPIAERRGSPTVVYTRALARPSHRLVAKRYAVASFLDPAS